MHDRAMAANSVADNSNQLLKRHLVGAGRVRYQIGWPMRGSHTEAREVIHVDRLHEVAAIAWYHEDRHTPAGSKRCCWPRPPPPPPKIQVGLTIE